MAERDIPDVVRKSAVGTAAELHAAGIGKSEIRSLVQTGHLVQFRRGVYATRKAVDNARKDSRRLHALQVAVVRATVGRDAIASHHSAARILGLEMLDPPPEKTVTVTRQPPTRSRTRRLDGVILHAAHIPDWQRLAAYGVSLTNASRTVIDIARTSPFRAGVAIADCAVRLDQTSQPELAAIVKACKGWPGVERARQVVEFCDGNAESVLESCARVAFADHGLEPALLQASIEVGDWRRFRVDFCWPQHRTIAEADGLGKYSAANDIRDQFERDRLLRRAGYQVVHFTWREIFMTPELIVAQIREAFAAPTGN